LGALQFGLGRAHALVQGQQLGHDSGPALRAPGLLIEVGIVANSLDVVHGSAGGLEVSGLL